MTIISNVNNNPVKKGARIGAAIGVINAGARIINTKDALKGMLETDVFASLPKQLKTPAIVAGLLLGTGVLTGVFSAIGAGVGKIVDVVKNKQAQKAEQAQ